jgi:hypothetical protein
VDVGIGFAFVVVNEDEKGGNGVELVEIISGYN